MKQRRVVVTLELATCKSLRALQLVQWWNRMLHLPTTEVLQAQANVIRKKLRKAK